jgi:hypothetical protein
LRPPGPAATASVGRKLWAPTTSRTTTWEPDPLVSWKATVDPSLLMAMGTPSGVKPLVGSGETSSVVVPSMS